MAGSKEATLKKYAKSSGISKGTLAKVYKRGLGAYYSSGSRPGVSAHQWAAGRVRSLLQAKVVLEKPMQIYSDQNVKRNNYVSFKKKKLKNQKLNLKLKRGINHALQQIFSKTKEVS